MTYHDDPDLERRLRRIAEPPQPPIPGSVYRYASEVTEHRRAIQVRPSFGFSSGGRRVTAFVGLAAVVIAAVTLTGVVISHRGNNTAAKPTPTSSEPSVSPTPVQPSFPTVDQLPPNYETPGADPNEAWTKVTFSPVTVQIQTTPLYSSPVRWSGGWVCSYAMGDSKWLAWTSADGRSWHASSAPGPALPTPAGLVAYDDQGYAWISVDGNVWRRHSVSGLDGASFNDRVGGSKGILASVVTEPGSPSTGLAFSPDGFTWQLPSLPVDSDGVRILDIAWTGSRFLATGTTPASATGDSMQLVALWSSDGVSWNKSTLEAPAGVTLREEVGLYTAQGGAIIEAYDDAGEFRWLWSADGSTWQPMPGSGPLVGLEARLYSNGERFVARSTTDGRMWSSFDGQTWAALQGKAPFPPVSDVDYFFGVFPRGIVYDNMEIIQYGTAQ
jgi:hypothetical protein